MKKLPQAVYIVLENAGQSEEYLNALRKIEHHAVVGEKQHVGVYELIDIRTVTVDVKSASGVH